MINTDQRDHIDFLMPLNIEARYPDEKTAIMKTLDYSKSRIIYERTEELLKWIQKLIMQ